MLEKMWKTINMVKVPDLASVVRETMRQEGDWEVHIGTDSQQSGAKTNFVTVLVVRNLGKGARAFYHKDSEPRIKTLRDRLLKEVWLSCELGMELSPMLGSKVGLTVHIDANPDVKFRSSDHIKELCGMATGMGFRTEIKPDSWVATHVADHIVKGDRFR